VLDLDHICITCPAATTTPCPHSPAQPCHTSPSATLNQYHQPPARSKPPLLHPVWLHWTRIKDTKDRKNANHTKAWYGYNDDNGFRSQAFDFDDKHTQEMFKFRAYSQPGTKPWGTLGADKHDEGIHKDATFDGMVRFKQNIQD